MKKHIKHTKHTSLVMPYRGVYGRREWTFIGAPCNIIHAYCKGLISKYAQYKIAFIDAAHQSDDQRKVNSSLNYVDNISHHTLEWEGSFDTYKAHSVHNEEDIVLVNGNHFKGKNQIVFIHPKKKESLQKKLDRLDSVSLFILCEGEEKIWDFLESDYADVPVLKLEDREGQMAFFAKQFASTIAPLCGLAMVGGKSTRMGEDKSQLDYHGIPQKEYVKNIMTAHVDKVYISDAKSNDNTPDVLVDTFTGLGPFGGILTAFRQYPETAFLVLACDLPLVNEDAVKYLISKRNPAKLATTFLNPQTGFADPLFTIWEPKSYMVLLQFLAQGYACPRKVLINSDVELLDLPDENWLRNANTPEERAEVFEMIRGGEINS